MWYFVVWFFDVGGGEGQKPLAYHMKDSNYLTYNDGHMGLKPLYRWDENWMRMDGVINSFWNIQILLFYVFNSQISEGYEYFGEEDI